jgi:protein TonB
VAWANSTCLLFLFIGIIGARTKAPIPKVPTPLEEAAPIIIEAPPPPPPPEAAKPPEQAEPEKAPAPLALVVPNAPSISFSIPTVGTLVAPSDLDQAPPAEALQLRQESSQPTRLSHTAGQGDRPDPREYPRMAERLHQQGTVMLAMTADADGNIVSCEVKRSSGFSILDRAAKDFVTLHWKLPKGQPGHVFETSIIYVLQKQ